MACKKCGSEGRFGRFYADNTFECVNCLNAVPKAIEDFKNGKPIAGQIVRARIKEKQTMWYKIKLMLGIVKEL